MHLITQTKQGISSIQLGHRLGVTQTTAWKIKIKLAEVMRIDSDREPPDGRVEMVMPEACFQHDANLGGERSGGKTGRGSPGKRPIVVAVQTSDGTKPVRIKLRRIARFKRKQVKSFARRILAPGALVVTDGLACFRGVADAGGTHYPILAGSGRRAAQLPSFRWINTVLGNIKTAITATYKAVRKKHLVRMLAEFEWRFNYCADLAAMIPRLVKADARSKPAPYWHLKWRTMVPNQELP